MSTLVVCKIRRFAKVTKSNEEPKGVGPGGCSRGNPSDLGHLRSRIWGFKVYLGFRLQGSGRRLSGLRVNEQYNLQFFVVFL